MSSLNIKHLAGGAIETKFKSLKIQEKPVPEKISVLRSLMDKIRKLESETLSLKLDLIECQSEVKLLKGEIQQLRNEKNKIAEPEKPYSPPLSAPATISRLPQSAPDPATLMLITKGKRQQTFKRSKTYIQDYFPENCILEEVLHCEKEKTPSKMRIMYNKSKNHFVDLDDGTIYSRLCDATKDHISKSGIQKKNVPSSYSSFKLLQGNKRHSIERLDIFPIKNE